MKLKVKKFNISSGGPLIALLNYEDANKLDLTALDRIRVKKQGISQVVAIDISKDKRTIKPGFIGLFEEVSDILKVKNNEIVDIEVEPKPISVDFIRKKLDGDHLSKMEINEIVRDIVENRLTETETTFFVSACYRNGTTIYESAYLTESIVENGKKLELDKYPILDKHSVGGAPGNRTTMIVVPIIAAAGYIIPKTSTRSITSAAGTSDTMEVLANVAFKIKDIKKIVEKVNGCMVWGGALEMATADDKLIKIEKVLNIDPEGILLASILAKKLAVGATHVVLDIPVGKDVKVKSRKQAQRLARKFKHLGKFLGMEIKPIISDASQPIGNGIGPALEARDVLLVLQNRGPEELKNKALLLAGNLLKMVGEKQAFKKAKEILESGKAYEKMKEIIKAQGGNPKIQPEQIKIGPYKYTSKAKEPGKVKAISNYELTRIAKAAGAPIRKGAGIYMHVKLNKEVKKGQPLFTIYAEDKKRLEFAISVLKASKPIEIESSKPKSLKIK